MKLPHNWAKVWFDPFDGFAERSRRVAGERSGSESRRSQDAGKSGSLGRMAVLHFRLEICVIFKLENSENPAIVLQRL